jgi:hypothetical protein
MANTQNPNEQWSPDDRESMPPKSGPSGATDRETEREKTFDAEGGAQSQGGTADDARRTTGGGQENDEDFDIEREDQDDVDADEEAEPDGLSQRNMKEGH